jgi:hypothetical protein
LQQSLRLAGNPKMKPSLPLPLNALPFSRQTMKTLNALRTESPLGNITLETSQESLCGAWFDDQKHGPSEAEQSRWHPSLLAPIEF